MPPPALSPGTYRFHGEGYDGQFYRYVAHDPLFQRGMQRYIDDPTNRYRRILVPLWLLCSLSDSSLTSMAFTWL